MFTARTLFDGNAPFLLTEGAAVVLFNPEFHAAIVERVVALAPNDDALLLLLVAAVLRLAAQTRVCTGPRVNKMAINAKTIRHREFIDQFRRALAFLRTPSTTFHSLRWPSNGDRTGHCFALKEIRLWTERTFNTFRN